MILPPADFTATDYVTHLGVGADPDNALAVYACDMTQELVVRHLR